MNARKNFYAYTYACNTHPVGEFVRDVEMTERIALETAASISDRLAHALNCWIKGCQHPASQVRLIEVQKS